MPLYEYCSSDPEQGCSVCRRGFELRRPLDRPALEKCPLCRVPVNKKISKTHVPGKGAVRLSAAKDAGFTVLKRRDEGVYEKI